MDTRTLATKLADLHLPAIRFYQVAGSTNDEAKTWAEQDAPDLALVVADEQTAGRGRAGRRWYTPAGAALAFSLVLHPSAGERPYLTRFTALGTLAVCQALSTRYGLAAQIKWPNDVLLTGRKVAGVLAETHWTGDQLTAVVLGIGINVATRSVSAAALPPAALNFPATCIEASLGRPPERLELLHAVLAALLEWRPRLGSPEFVPAWEASLAFRDQWVFFVPGEGSGTAQEALVLGLAPDGALRLRTRQGVEITANIGELRLAGGFAPAADR
jgi:BirA family biotin operon repressor/biotin-[acetyl-CoA-carboxylase] ligase